MTVKRPPLGPGSPDAPKLESLIAFLEAQARELVDDWTYDGTTFETDQHTRLAALALYDAAIHLRSLRAVDWRARKLGPRRARKKVRT